MDPLAQLKDIHLPEQINNYPLAPGWWLLAILLICLTIVSIVRLRKYLLIRKDKKTAIAQLQNVIKNSSNKSLDENNAEIIAIIKWASLKYFPRAEVASLYGENFQTFLLNTLPEKKKAAFETLSEGVFSELYKKHQHEENSTKETQLQKVALHWLTFALPVKVPKAIPLTNGAEEKTQAKPTSTFTSKSKSKSENNETPDTTNSQATKQAGELA
ncbi:MAG: DUF4381 domain-containing protein [Alteromonadaceae bacterium]|nr:DUF4381 domain-containing protein [Alteromonadaceae bacterium]